MYFLLFLHSLVLNASGLFTLSCYDLVVFYPPGLKRRKTIKTKMWKRKNESRRTGGVSSVGTRATLGETVLSIATSNRGLPEHQVQETCLFKLSDTKTDRHNFNYFSETTLKVPLSSPPAPHMVRTIVNSQSIPIPQAAADGTGRTRQPSECVSVKVRYKTEALQKEEKIHSLVLTLWAWIITRQEKKQPNVMTSYMNISILMRKKCHINSNFKWYPDHVLLWA